MGGYRSQAAVKPLAMTGALERMVVRRIAETSRFVLDVTGSETLPRASEGWKSTARVRLMHAIAKALLVRQLPGALDRSDVKVVAEKARSWKRFRHDQR